MVAEVEYIWTLSTAISLLLQTELEIHNHHDQVSQKIIIIAIRCFFENKVLKHVFHQPNIVPKVFWRIQILNSVEIFYFKFVIVVFAIRKH